MAAVAQPTGVKDSYEAVTIALDTAYVPPLRGFRTAATGDVAIIDCGGTTRTIKSLLAGESVMVGIQQILTSGTTVTSPTTNILGLR